MSATERRVALVSGGSRGIGRATVLRLARDGFDVAFCYQSNPEAAQELEKEVADLGGTAVGERVDVVDRHGVRDWIAATEDRLGPISVAVTSAGVLRDGPLVLMKDEDWDTVLGVNLDGTYNICRAVIFSMVKRKSGCIVNVSSVAGVAGTATQSNYSASKAGIIGFTRALAKEVGRYGVRANVVAPGFVDTDMVSALSGKVREKALAGIPLGRFGTPDEVAHAVSYLVNAAYVTGEVLRIDGGMI
jgi:3-oxoacyl-[acyl-carrier protein] reductase